MPTPASARLLAEECLEEGGVVNPTVVWTPPKERKPRTSCGVWLAALIAILMFLLGVCLGAFLNALAPEGAFPLGFLGDQPDAAASNGSSLIIPRNESLAEEMELEDSRERRKFSGEEDTVEEREGLTTTESKEEEEEETTTRTSKKWKKSKKESDEDQNGEITINTTTVGSTEEENSGQGEVDKNEVQDPENEETTQNYDKEENRSSEEEPTTTTEAPEEDENLGTSIEIQSATEEPEEEEKDLPAKKKGAASQVDKKKKPKCDNFPWDSDRLPLDVKPLYYTLTMHPNATGNILEGKVVITLDVIEKTDIIILNAERLTLEAFRLEVNNKPMEADHLECPALTMWGFQLEKFIYPNNKIELELNFKGSVLNDFQGLYISTHTDEKKARTKSMVTQFEPTYARRAFPCFDEPSFKAEFHLSVVREAGNVVRSNMNLKKSMERHDGLYLDEFHPTLKMSTYLVAFAVLDGYEYARKLAKKTSKPIEVRIYAPSDLLKGQSDFGLDTAVRALEYFEDYFNISYPLEKIDLIALDDFSEGAMENWGMATFRDTALLYAPNSSALFREYIALVICHEVAHQWFGNLVTMMWFDELYLNEGFANYMEYRCVDNLFPEWNIMTRFFADNVISSMELDGMPSSRAIASAEKGQALINLFDAIAYHKAAAVIHMIQHLAGEKNFRTALIEYLNKYKFGNAQGEDLWKIVEKNAHLGKGISISGLAKKFTTQVGYPVIKVATKDDGVIEAGNQSRFFYDSMRKGDKTEWPLYLVFRVDGEEETKTKWLKKHEEDVSIRLGGENKWTVVNSGGIGYFRVQYDTEMYQALANQLEDDPTEFSAVDRTMILADAFELSRGARLNISTYMDLLSYTDEETDRVVWLQLSRHMKTIEYLINESDFINTFKDFERSVILPAYDKFAWNASAEPALRFELVQFACRIRIRDCTKKTLAAYNDWNKNKVRPPPELTGIILEEGVRQGGTATFERTLSALLNETRTVTEKQHLLAALTGTRDPASITKLLKLCTDHNTIRPGVVPRVIHHIMSNEVARSMAWRHFKLHFDEFVKILGESSNLLIACIRAVGERLSTREELHELQEFLKNRKSVEKSSAKLEQIYEQIRMNIQWRQLQEDDLRGWLEKWDTRRRVVQRARRFLH